VIFPSEFKQLIEYHIGEILELGNQESVRLVPVKEDVNCMAFGVTYNFTLLFLETSFHRAS
jgi:hypothetical protein